MGADPPTTNGMPSGDGDGASAGRGRRTQTRTTRTTTKDQAASFSEWCQVLVDPALRTLGDKRTTFLHKSSLSLNIRSHAWVLLPLRVDALSGRIDGLCFELLR